MENKVVKIQKRNIVLKNQIGSGSYSKVYLASFRCIPIELECEQNIQHVAVKICNPKNGKTREDVLAEIMNMSKARHQNIVNIIGILDSGKGIPWLIMEFMRNGTVFDIIRKGNLEEPLRLRMMCDIASGMSYLHSAMDMVHGDLHSKNCFIDINGVTKVGDFGFTWRSNSAFQPNPYDFIPTRTLKAALVKHCSRHTRDLPRWFPPEYLLTSELDLDDLLTHKAGDVWSYGTLAFQIWAQGHSPFDDLNCRQVHAALLSGIDPFDCLKINLPITVLTLIMSCWEYEPPKRPTFNDILSTLTSHFASLSPTTPTHD